MKELFITLIVTISLIAFVCKKKDGRIIIDTSGIWEIEIGSEGKVTDTATLVVFPATLTLHELFQHTVNSQPLQELTKKGQCSAVNLPEKKRVTGGKTPHLNIPALGLAPGMEVHCNKQILPIKNLIT